MVEKRNGKKSVEETRNEMECTTEVCRKRSMEDQRQEGVKMVLV